MVTAEPILMCKISTLMSSDEEIYQVQRNPSKNGWTLMVPNADVDDFTGVDSPHRMPAHCNCDTLPLSSVSLSGLRVLLVTSQSAVKDVSVVTNDVSIAICKNCTLLVSLDLKFSD